MSENKSRIPIKNIYYMLCYAWDVLDIKNDILVDEDDFNDAYDLLSRIFAYGVGKLIRSGFHKSYIDKQEELSTLKGKVNISESIKTLSFLNKRYVCNYDDYSANDIFNQIIKYTMNSIIRNKSVNKKTRDTIKKQLPFFANIDEKEPTKENRVKLTFNRNNVIYKMIIQVAIMLYDNTMVNEEEGNNVFKDFFREEQMQKVFELFLLNFYKVNLDTSEYRVHAPKIDWHIEENAEDTWLGLFDVETKLTDRRTDIVVENKKLRTQFIIDAKYYEHTFVNAYMNNNDERVRTSHLNQVRGYVLDSDFNGDKFGALIYPMTNNDIKNGRIFPIKGSNIIVKTVNLNDNWKNIEADLLDFVHKIEKRHI